MSRAPNFDFARDIIAKAHHDALIECGGNVGVLKVRLEELHQRIGDALSGERLSIALIALTQAVADLGRQYDGVGGTKQ